MIFHKITFVTVFFLLIIRKKNITNYWPQAFEQQYTEHLQKCQFKKKSKSCEINAKHFKDKCAVKDVSVFYSDVIFNNENSKKWPWAVAMLHGRYIRLSFFFSNFDFTVPFFKTMKHKNFFFNYFQSFSCTFLPGFVSLFIKKSEIQSTLKLNRQSVHLKKYMCRVTVP